MKIVVDQNIPFAQQLLEQHGDIVAVDGRKLSASDIADADVLFVRSVSRVDANLIAAAKKLKFVGTATIGTEHVDQHALAQAGIGFASAPGCNALAVSEYVLTALHCLSEVQQFDLREKRIAIIGAGNTGSAVAKKMRAMGMQVELCDPPLEAQGKLDNGVSLARALSADIISLHVPLDQYPDYPTQHLLNAERLAALRDDQILVNASRGAVIDNRALLARMQAANPPSLILDVWENEPDVLNELVPYAFIATPHIAGYSLEGKMRGTSMIYAAMCEHLGLVYNDQSEALLPPSTLPSVNGAKLDLSEVGRMARFVYDIYADDRRFRQDGLSAEGFDNLRKFYPERREFSALSITNDTHEHWKNLGFTSR